MNFQVGLFCLLLFFEGKNNMNKKCSWKFEHLQFCDNDKAQSADDEALHHRIFSKNGCTCKEHFILEHC